MKIGGGINYGRSALLAMSMSGHQQNNDDGQSCVGRSSKRLVAQTAFHQLHLEFAGDIVIKCRTSQDLWDVKLIYS